MLTPDQETPGNTSSSVEMAESGNIVVNRNGHCDHSPAPLLGDSLSVTSRAARATSRSNIILALDRLAFTQRQHNSADHRHQQNKPGWLEKDEIVIVEYPA